jgi:branched-chain amino acid transport system substrate-binding protein
MSRLPVLLAVALATALLSACSTDEQTAETLISGDTLTVYSSLPLTGPLAPVSRDIVRAEKLALAEAGGRTGAFSVAYVSMNSAAAKTGQWDPAIVAANARRAVSDRQTIAYLGEAESGASAISVPLLNSAGMLQVSPLDSYAGLTVRGEHGEPEKYYPSGRRTFGRVVAADDVQARVMASSIRRAPLRSVVIADDRQLAGVDLGDRVAAELERGGVRVAERLSLDAGDDVPEDLADTLAEHRADAFVYTGEHAPFGVELLRAAHAAAPRLRLFAGDDVAMLPRLGRRLGATAGRVVVTAPDLPAGPEAVAFRRTFTRTYGHAPAREAILGYEAMRRVLAAVDRVGDRASSRRAVIAEALGVQTAPSAGFASYEVTIDRVVRLRSGM